MTDGMPSVRKVAPNLLLHGVSHHQPYGKGSTAYTVSLEEFDLVVDRGEWLGLLGTRKDGLDLVVQIVSGNTTPEAGTIFEAGRPMVLSSRDGFIENESLSYNLTRLGMARRLNGVQLRRTIDVVADEAGLAGSLNESVTEIDRTAVGRARLYMAIALGVSILVIDQPEDLGGALDEEDVAGKLRAFSERGASIVIASSDVRELSRHCDRVVWLWEGGSLMDSETSEVVRWQKEVRRLQRAKESAKVGQLRRRLKRQYGPPGIRLVDGDSSREKAE